MDESREYCIAVLDGLYRYIRESKAEFKDHAQDDPQIAFGWVEDQWREGVTKIALLDQFSEEVGERFPDWGAVDPQGGGMGPCYAIRMQAQLQREGRRTLRIRRSPFLARVEMPSRLRFQDAAGDTVWAFEIGEVDQGSIVASEIVPVAR